jgi:hypothetical protein
MMTGYADQLGDEEGTLLVQNQTVDADWSTTRLVCFLSDDRCGVLPADGQVYLESFFGLIWFYTRYPAMSFPALHPRGENAAVLTLAPDGKAFDGQSVSFCAPPYGLRFGLIAREA